MVLLSLSRVQNIEKYENRIRYCFYFQAAKCLHCVRFVNAVEYDCLRRDTCSLVTAQTTR